MSNLVNQRIFWSDNGTIVDVSNVLADFRSNSQTLPIVAAEDKIYIGSLLPLNHKWIEMSTANDQASAITVDIWWGDKWNPALDILDFTASSGVTLAQSGILRFQTDRLKGWDRELDAFDVTGLTGVNINDYYWCRLNFSADLNISTSISYVGHNFSDDDDLYSFYPDLNNSDMQTAFASGKSDWKEQHFMAAQIIIRDLRTRRVILERDQIIDYQLFNEASIHKVAEIIYGAFGEDRRDDMGEARKKYNEAINIKQYNMDENRDGRLSESERAASTRFFTR